MRGYPYEQIIQGRIHNSTNALQRLAYTEDYRKKVETKIADHSQDLEPLYNLGFHGLDALVKSPDPLTFEQCFSLGAYVCLTSNSALYDALASRTKGYEYGLLEKDTLRLRAVSLLQAMSTREGIIGLAPQEIAGLVAATLELDTVVRIKTPHDLPTFTFGGMGGDKGLKVNGYQSKLFAVSTLATIALAEFGSVHKHHSYPNTSRVAGQSAVEALGARSDFDDSKKMEDALDVSNVLMTSCHSTRTLHTISHALKGETINHVIGPIAAPHSETNDIHALVGVNHNVHPATVIDSLKILQSKGIQRYGNSVAFCGIEAPVTEVPLGILNPNYYYIDNSLKRLVAIDEVPPPPYTTMASFLVNGENAGTFLIAPTDFMDAEEARVLEGDHLLIPNTTEEILAANKNVINGSDHIKSRYVAMTVALAIFAKEYASQPGALDQDVARVNSTYLRECYRMACDAMTNGNLEKRVRLYAELTQKDVLPDIDLVIVDIDNTLVKPVDPEFYRKYGEAVNMATSDYLSVSLDEGKRIADFYRQNFGGGEMALFSGTIGQFFPEHGEYPPNFALLYDRMCTIDTTDQFKNDGITSKLIGLLRSQGKKVVAITDSPEGLSRKILADAGIDPDQDFDLYLPYTSDYGPLKILQRGTVFERVARHFNVPPERTISIGDSYPSDIEPAKQIGMNTCLISPHIKDGYSGSQAGGFEYAFEAYRRACAENDELTVKTILDAEGVVGERALSKEQVYALVLNSGIQGVIEKIDRGRGDVFKYRVRRNGKQEVLKISPKIESTISLSGRVKRISETEENIRGYKQMHTIGANLLIPRYETYEADGFEALFVEYLGEDLEAMLGHLEDGSQLIPILSGSLERTYQLSQSAYNEVGEQFLKMVADIAQGIYGKVLPEKKIIEMPVTNAKSVLMSLEKPSRQCFAMFDLQPGNIFVLPDRDMEDRVKIIDPKEQVVGVPLIDIACLTGVLSYKGLIDEDSIETLRLLALKVGREILGCSQSVSESYFRFGLALQKGLSAAFNRSLSMERRQEIATEGVKVLKSI